jgi:hypothetical protein
MLFGHTDGVAGAGTSGHEESTKALRIGELAARTGVSRDTLRHYDRLGQLELLTSRLGPAAANARLRVALRRLRLAEQHQVKR